MAELTPGGLQIAVEDRGRVGQHRGSAAAVLQPLRRVVPFQAAWIALLDPECCEQMPPTPRRIHRGGPGPDRYAGPLLGNQWTIADRGATVLGIDFTNDLVLQIRDLSCPDTQLIRLGGQNFGHCRCQSTEL
jgi:hypothetical protein